MRLRRESMHAATAPGARGPSLPSAENGFDHDIIVMVLAVAAA